MAEFESVSDPSIPREQLANGELQEGSTDPERYEPGVGGRRSGRGWLRRRIETKYYAHVEYTPLDKAVVVAGPFVQQWNRCPPQPQAAPVPATDPQQPFKYTTTPLPSPGPAPEGEKIFTRVGQIFAGCKVEGTLYRLTIEHRESSTNRRDWKPLGRPVTRWHSKPVDQTTQNPVLIWSAWSAQECEGTINFDYGFVDEEFEEFLAGLTEKEFDVIVQEGKPA